MKEKKFELIFDCGSSKIRGGAINIDNIKQSFFYESKFSLDQSDINFKIKDIITSLEKNTDEYIDSTSLMIDSQEMLTIGISISKKLDGSKLKKEDIQFLIQDAKQQILKNYSNQNIVHIIIQNYKIDDTDYNFFPNKINCNLISIDTLFICIPKNIVEYYKKLFFKLDISINQIFCSSYAKSLNYKNNFFLNENILFIDIGFKKTSIIYYNKNEIIFFDVLPIGGNHITSDISKILNLNMEDSENIKTNFDQKKDSLDKKKISPNLIQQIISARIEEILELSLKTIKLNLDLKLLDQHKVVLMGDGSKILDNKFKEKISFSKKIELIEETTEDICESAFKIIEGFNKQEVVIVPKRQRKRGFFEKLFHLFR